MAKFRLESVLKFRRYREESRKLELSKVVAEELRQKEKVMRLAELRREGSTTLRQSQRPGPLDMGAVLDERRYLGQLDREIYLGLSDVSKAEGITAEYRKGVVEAMKERKALEVLEGRYLRAAQARTMAAEAAALDEMALTRFGRGRAFQA